MLKMKSNFLKELKRQYKENISKILETDKYFPKLFF